ncbi:hypothetical protein GWI33_021064 [Rhynchophorus ferrugineus]|uniref:Uncharacterized protein n=1 Tax=Rhynchophorus ferrugineus TaxID=354439 RepID=A0A834M563_RHYFE|nr:hypothetical protein GWI33_021064 [Rhynchophorus ferrugineus]
MGVKGEVSKREERKSGELRKKIVWIPFVLVRKSKSAGKEKNIEGAGGAAQGPRKNIRKYPFYFFGTVGSTLSPDPK